MKKKLFYMVFICLQIILAVNTYAQMQLEWARRYRVAGSDDNSAFGICLDNSGNIYVTGAVQLGGGFRCATIKYNEFGDSLWVRNFQRLESSFNVGYDIAVDDSGFVFVAGASYLLKYDKFGNFLWMRYDSAVFNKIILDTSGNFYASGVGLGKFVTVKYNKNGNRIWIYKQISGYQLNDMILDRSGNIIITGKKEYAGTSYDYTTIKYSNTGSLLWLRSYNGPAPPIADDDSHAVASDTSGNVYVTGASMNENSIFNCVTIKYDSLGNQIWLKRIYPPSNAFDIQVDKSQNVYIASRSNGNNYTTKLDKDGNVVWMRTYPYSFAFSINKPVLILDSINNVYVSANSDSISSTSYAALKYDNNGNRIFLVAYGYHPIGSNYVYDMAVDKKGKVYLTGESNLAYGTVKFSPIITGISGNTLTPQNFSLSQNFPNPFNPVTVIRYSLLAAREVSLKVYDVLGKVIASLVNQKQNAGSYSATFDGSSLPSGIYFYRLEADGNVVDTKRMVLLK